MATVTDRERAKRRAIRERAATSRTRRIHARDCSRWYDSDWFQIPLATAFALMAGVGAMTIWASLLTG